MRQYIIASHAHFATGIKESVELLSGARDNVHDLSMFVDGRMDVAEEAQNCWQACLPTMMSLSAPTSLAVALTTSSPRSSRRVPARTSLPT
ncbi:MAG: hypothetical protein ACLU37_11855 [Collinsella sp.]